MIVVLFSQITENNKIHIKKAKKMFALFDECIRSSEDDETFTSSAMELSLYASN